MVDAGSVTMNEATEIYSSLEEAGKLIRQRWADAALKKKISVFVGNSLEEVLPKGPYAILSRNIASPDFEYERFIVLAQEIELPPVVFEGADDKFSTNSHDKLGLVKMSIFDGYDKNRRIRRHYRTIIDIPANDGKKFREIKTLWGENLVDCHHRLLDEHSGGPVRLFDDLAWYRSTVGGIASVKDYYLFFLAFFICRGVLFETFTMVGKESQFTTEIFLPAFQEIVDRFGVKPLIVPIIPVDEVENPYWFCYAGAIESSLG
jgi:hypothetical protein